MLQFRTQEVIFLMPLNASIKNIHETFPRFQNISQYRLVSILPKRLLLFLL